MIACRCLVIWGPLGCTHTPTTQILNQRTDDKIKVEDAVGNRHSEEGARFFGLRHELFFAYYGTVHEMKPRSPNLFGSKGATQLLSFGKLARTKTTCLGTYNLRCDF